jgi:amino acid transporter
VSLLVLCSLGFIFSLLFKLADVINSILAMRILVQFIGQAVGIILLRRHFGTKDLPFKMWLYPLPVILSISIWLFVFVSTGLFALWGSLIALSGIAVYYIAKRFKEKNNY